MRISDWSSDVCSSDLPAAASAPAPAPAKTAEPAQDESASAALTLSPAVRRLVLEHGVDPTRIKGTGKDGRLTKDDVMAAVQAGGAHAAAPAAMQSPSPASAPAASARQYEPVRLTPPRPTVPKRP